MDSIWSKTCKQKKRTALAGEIRADVAVIGGGMTGILTAWHLEQAGICTVILEADQIGGGQTKNTTAKITSQHGMFCHRFLEKKGEEKARNYVQDVYSSDKEKLRQEIEAARRLGINASFVEHIEIPVSCAGAVMFPHQAAFHPLKFLEALAWNLTVYEDTLVTEVRGHQVKTSCGSVKADKIIFAAHRTGENQAGGQYENLKKTAAEMYPQSQVTACWSAQDCITADGIPFIGRYSEERPDWFVATGFQKWGMSSAMVSAMLLRDMICGISNPYKDIFVPSRFSAEEIPQIMKDSGKAVKGLTKRFFHLPGGTADELLRGHGAVTDTPQGKAGVYKTEEGKLCQVDIVCPHMGCELNWNPEELTWDCPCHGSRFDREGNLIDGPAQEGISHG